MILALLLVTVDCDKAPSGLDVRICLGKLAEQTDREMAAQWKLTYAALRSETAKNRRSGANRPDLARGLLESQRAWLRYREAQCDMISDQVAGGTAYGEFDSRCRIRLNRERQQQLRQRAEAMLLP